jgi:PilZ domain
MPDTPPEVALPVSARVERRAFRRTLCNLPVMLETESSSRPAQSLNVSGGGIKLRTELELGLGEEVGIYFELPIGYAVETRAKVLRTDSTGTALCFLDLSKEAVVALRSFCRLSGLHKIETK